MRSGSTILAFTIIAFAAAAGASPTAPRARQASSQTELADRYRAVAARIQRAALADGVGWERLAWLTDRIGNRLSGSAALQQAVAWALDQMAADGLENVRALPVQVPHWVRGEESLRMVAPRELPLAMLGLGGSVGTPAEGLEAEVVPVSSFEELESRPAEQIQGRIVLFNVPFESYGRTVRYRTAGAVAAARRGAVAALVRSVGPVSLQTPHTGAMRYEEGVARIPAAAVTIEGAELIQRLVDRGVTVTVRLRMQAQTLPDAPSADVIGELVGSERPEQVVVLGGHLDSWDVGQGAHDDGAGCIAAWRAVTLLRDLGLRPRRTVRVVLWTNEENGLAGARAYREAVGDRVAAHVAAIEMDSGSERPVGFGLGLAGVDPGAEDPRYEHALQVAGQIVGLLEPIGATEVFRGGGGADIGPLMQSGVPGFGLRTVGKHYFDWHHTQADTLDKIAVEDFRRNVAALAVLAYVLADMPGRLVPAGGA